jgi:hypothetical protein
VNYSEGWKNPFRKKEFDSVSEKLPQVRWKKDSILK